MNHPSASQHATTKARARHANAEESGQHPEPNPSILKRPADREASPIWQGYPGSKAAAGVAHQIIGQMPPHRIYIELFLGFGTIIRSKRPAEWNIGIDIDQNVIQHWRTVRPAGIVVARGDALRILSTWTACRDRHTLIYIDAPYLRSTRTRTLYTHEFLTDVQHASLIEAARLCECNVIISHYPNPLYANALADWRTIQFKAMTRGAVRVEQLWMNFPEPTRFHDTRFCGNGWRERDRVKKKTARWRRRLAAMPAWERQIIAGEIARIDEAKQEHSG